MPSYTRTPEDVFHIICRTYYIQRHNKTHAKTLPPKGYLTRVGRYELNLLPSQVKNIIQGTSATVSDQLLRDRTGGGFIRLQHNSRV